MSFIVQMSRSEVVLKSAAPRQEAERRYSESGDIECSYEDILNLIGPLCDDMTVLPSPSLMDMVCGR